MKQQKPRRSSRTVKAISRAVRRAPVRVESLEERRLLTVISVTSADDSGAGTLRAAIDQANGDAGPDTIEFAIGGDGVAQIQLMSALPEVTTSVTIDGTTQSGYTSAGGPLIWIDGSAAGNPDGLVISGGNSTVKGLAVTGMNNGIALTGADGDAIRDCYIGIDPTHPTSIDSFNAFNGIDVQNGDDVIAGNVIGNSFFSGVRVAGANVTISGNIIGMDPSGLVAVANFSDGIFVDGASGGGDATITGNVLSGNFGSGVRLGGAQGVRIAGNLIGTDGTGAAPFGNSGDGITIEDGSANNQVGGNTLADRNVISGNDFGVQITDSNDNTVLGNYIGIAADGSAGDGGMGNAGQGVEINGDSTGNLVGAGNVISGNGGYGVGLFASGNFVQGNFVGTGPGGIGAIGNLQDGVHVEGDANVIGSGAGSVIPPQANVIAYNGFAGVAVVSGQENSIRGNSIHDNSQDGFDTSVGIDLVETIGFDEVRGPTANHAPGTTSGPNHFQGYPELTSIVRTGSSAMITGQLQGVVGASYVVDLYGSTAPHPSNFGEGEHYLGSVTVTIAAGGYVAFTKSVGGVDSSDSAFTATATDADGNTSEFSAALLSVVASPVPTMTVLTSSANPSVFGQALMLTATVSTFVPGTVFSGQVEFRDGGTLLASVAVSATGVATFTAPAGFSIGDHALTATYLGDGGTLDGSSADLTQTVTLANTATTVSSAPNPSQFGQTVVLTATVGAAAPGAGTPTGTVVFKDGTTVLGSATLSGGVATFSASALSVGSHLITAEYAGDSSFTASSNFTEQTVNPAGTHTSVTSSVNPSTLGQSVTFTATVGVDAPGAGTPTGTVNFFDGSTPIGSATLSGSTASISISSLGVGSHNITVVYVGAASFTTSTSASLTQTVNKTVSQTTLSSSVNPSVFGQPVMFTATVLTSAGLPASTGMVTFMDGATVLGTGTVSGGIATLTTGGLSVGSHSVTATYGGDSNYTGSVSPTLTQVVQQAASTTTLTSSMNPSAVGQSVTLTATVGVVAPGVPSATGTVTFSDGATTLGTATLVGGVASLNVAFASAGAHVIVATYGGNTNVAASSGSLTQMVNPAATGTTLASSANPSDAGQSVTFTATVSAPAGAGTPTGTVTFRDGSTVLATVTLTSGVATFATSTLSVANHTISATYNGAANYATSAASLTQVVRAPANSTLSGYVYVDRNNDGIKQSTEQGISCVTVKLVNSAGQIVGTATTGCGGDYTFTNVVSGVYTIIETQPAHYVDGIESAGSLGGDASGDNNTISAIPVGSGQTGTDYNFGELPETFVDTGETATIGFWQNKNGQALIKSFNGGATSTQLATWLSTTFPHIYGAGSPNSLVGKNGNDVAALFVKLFKVTGQKLDAQVLGVALAVYATTNTLGGNAAVKYGFTVDAIGTGHRLYNVTSNGAAFGVANNTNMEVLDILSACDVRAVNGVLYNGNTSLRNMANNVFDGINQQGDIT